MQVLGGDGNTLPTDSTRITIVVLGLSSHQPTLLTSLIIAYNISTTFFFSVLESTSFLLEALVEPGYFYHN